MNMLEFDLLYKSLKQDCLPSQRRLAEEEGVSLGKINETLKSLKNRGMLEDDGKITSSGVVALEPYRVRNAVILAAGMSTRFVPFSFEKPKGLMVCRGEVLIERQIEQLREAGITEIVIVVGYMMEQFFYLREKYGVTIVVNPEYTTRNNNGSIWAARNYLGNSYVCASDNYFTTNVFESHVFRSFYDSVYAEGEVNERGLFFDSDGRIYKTERPTADKWLMFGKSYWSFGFAKKFLKILEEDYDKPGIKDYLWEWVYDLHIGELDLYVKQYPKGTVMEFDSLADLREFDEHYINNAGSKILENICSVLGCTPAEIVGIVPLKGGVTNKTFRFEVGGERYVYRHPGEHDIDREREAKAQHIAADLGIDGTLVHMDTKEGWKVSRFVEVTGSVDLSDPVQLDKVMSLVAKLQSSGASVDWEFDFWDGAERTVRGMSAPARERLKPFEDLRCKISALNDYLKTNPWEKRLSHNDISAPNLLVDGEEVSLIDWEFAGNNDAGYDVSKPVMRAGLIGVEARKAFGRYYGREITMEEEKHLMACAAVTAWFWFTWDLNNEAIGVSTGNFLLMWHDKAVTYADYALSI